MNTLKGYRILSTLVCLALLLALTIGNVNASPTRQGEADFAAIDAYVTEQMNNLGIPGMALGIVQDDQIVHLGGFGVADSSGRAVTPQTPFYIGSVTKSFTALAVMQLVEAGKIDLDAPVQEYLPWFELADKAASAKITVRHLLNQTTGISNKDGNRAFASQKGLEESVRGYNSIQPTQPVGETYQYSNLNYNIAGLIVEQVSGQSYADYVAQHVFQPLEMHHSYGSRVPALADGMAEGHYYMSGHAFRRELVVSPAHFPAAFLITSVEDMTHYAIAQLNDGRYGQAAILSAQGIAELHTPAIPTGGGAHYAMGWEVGILDGMRLIAHEGANSTFVAIFTCFLSKAGEFILLANAHSFEQFRQLTEVAKGVLNMLNGKAPTPVTLPFNLRFLYWTIVLMPLLQILGIAYSWRYWRNKGAAHILLTVILYGTVALLGLLGVPQLTGLPIWSGLRIIYPELGYGLIAVATLGIGWSVVYTAMNLRMLRTK